MGLFSVIPLYFIIFMVFIPLYFIIFELFIPLYSCSKITSVCRIFISMSSEKIIYVHLLSMLKSKYFDHYFQFMLIFYILVRKVGDFGP